MIDNVKDYCHFCNKVTEQKFEHKVDAVNAICCECNKIVEQIFDDENDWDFTDDYLEHLTKPAPYNTIEP